MTNWVCLCEPTPKSPFAAGSTGVFPVAGVAAGRSHHEPRLAGELSPDGGGVFAILRGPGHGGVGGAGPGVCGGGAVAGGAAPARPGKLLRKILPAGPGGVREFPLSA